MNWCKSGGRSSLVSQSKGHVMPKVSASPDLLICSPVVSCALIFFSIVVIVIKRI